MEIADFFHQIRTPVTIIHVISVVFGMGAALLSDVLFTFFSKDKKLNKTELSTLSILSRVVIYSLVIIFISGIIIFFSDIEKYLASAKFLAKMTILGVLLVNGYLLQRYVWPHLLNKNFFTQKKEKEIRRVAFGAGAVSVISWLMVCTLGVLDKLSFSYGVILSSYVAVILVGVLVALVVEKRVLN